MLSPILICLMVMWIVELNGSLTLAKSHTFN